MKSANSIIGRYAPSPTGPMHLGNLRTALLAWLHTRLQGGAFRLRMDDLDTPRVVAGSADQILRDMEWLGLDWDDEVLYQSERIDVYQQALDGLNQQGLIYECFCSRKDIQQAVSAPHRLTAAYPGTCRALTDHEKEIKRQQKSPALRIRVTDKVIKFDDGCLGTQSENLSEQCGDFVVKRADGLFAYQLAIVVDDIEQGISDVVRGADLLTSTARQLYLMQQLRPDHDLPRFWHVPLMLDEQGERMAKRDGAQSVSEWRQSGGDQSELVGFLAHSVGLIDQAMAVSPQQLLSEITFEQLKQNILS